MSFSFGFGGDDIEPEEMDADERIETPADTAQSSTDSSTLISAHTLDVEDMVSFLFLSGIIKIFFLVLCSQKYFLVLQQNQFIFIAISFTSNCNTNGMNSSKLYPQAYHTICSL